MIKIDTIIKAGFLWTGNPGQFVHYNAYFSTRTRTIGLAIDRNMFCNSVVLYVINPQKYPIPLLNSRIYRYLHKKVFYDKV